MNIHNTWHVPTREKEGKRVTRPNRKKQREVHQSLIFIGEGPLAAETLEILRHDSRGRQTKTHTVAQKRDTWTGRIVMAAHVVSTSTLTCVSECFCSVLWPLCAA